MEKNIQEIAKEIAEIIYRNRTERGLEEMVFEIYKSGGIYWTYGFRYPQHTPKGEETWFYVHSGYDNSETFTNYRIDTDQPDATGEDYKKWLQEAERITADKIIEEYYENKDEESPIFIDMLF